MSGDLGATFGGARGATETVFEAVRRFGREAFRSRRIAIAKWLLPAGHGVVKECGWEDIRV